MHQNTSFYKENDVKDSKYWYNHFNQNLKAERVNWKLKPQLSNIERNVILKSLQAWQLGETSDGRHLLKASEKYAQRNNDLLYIEAVKLFTKEEQKHGSNLGKYLDLISEKRIDYDWGDYLFRKIRYFNTNMELWTLTVITVESTAQLFYQSLKDATNCELLKQICTDILIDEAFHIEFQSQRVSEILKNRQKIVILLSFYMYKLFYFSTILVVWYAHKKVFKAGQNNFGSYFRKMNIKFKKTIERQKNIALSAIKNQM
jgi:hypothetical protein